MPPLGARADHTKGNRPEQPEQRNNRHVEDRENGPLELLPQAARGPVRAEAGGQDGEVERRIVVVDVGDAGHGDEGQIVQEPADDRVEAGVVDVVDVGLLQLIVAALPPHQVPEHQQPEHAERGRAAPVDGRVA
jgi:hypothetical protein